MLTVLSAKLYFTTQPTEKSISKHKLHNILQYGNILFHKVSYTTVCNTRAFIIVTVYFTAHATAKVFKDLQNSKTLFHMLTNRTLRNVTEYI